MRVTKRGERLGQGWRECAVCWAIVETPMMPFHRRWHDAFEQRVPDRLRFEDLELDRAGRVNVSATTNLAGPAGRVGSLGVRREPVDVATCALAAGGQLVTTSPAEPTTGDEPPLGARQQRSSSRFALIAASTVTLLIAAGCVELVSHMA